MAFSTLLQLFLVFSLTFASEAQREIKAESGDDVTLQCQSPRAVTLLEWSRADLKSDGYLFFYRNERSYGNYQHPSFIGRVQLKDPEMKDGDVSVILKNVNINDTGSYECRVLISSTDGRERDLIEIKDRVSLTVGETGETAENVWTEEAIDEEKKDGFGVMIVLTVVGVLLLLILLLGLVMFRKHQTSVKRPSYRLQSETGSVLLKV